LESARKDNAHLRRKLAQAGEPNRQQRAAPPTQPHDRQSYVRRMLNDPRSRNP